MKKLLEEYLDDYENGFNHKNALRYLYKRKPELWQSILEATSFLPEDAKPKQRCWHILNEVFNIPVCPVEKVLVKWNENRYLTYSSLSAKAKSLEVTKQRMATYKERTGFDSWNGKDNPVGHQKFKDTCIKNWGVENPSHSKVVLEKIKRVRTLNGSIRSLEQITAREIYDVEVKEVTKQSWWDHYSKINPEGVERGNGYELDHIYSRAEGFKNNVPPEIMGHWTNLQMLTKSENASKCARCDKTLEELYEDYNE